MEETPPLNRSFLCLQKILPPQPSVHSRRDLDGDLYNMEQTLLLDDIYELHEQLFLCIPDYKKGPKMILSIKRALENLTAIAIINFPFNSVTSFSMG